MATIDVTDASFQTDVIDRSAEQVVVIDLWAEWCGPCKTLGPILEKVVGAAGDDAVLAKVDVDANPRVSQAFQVQSIPAVYAMKDGKVVDGFVGAQPEATVEAWLSALLPTEEQNEVQKLVAAGDEASLRQALDLEPDNVDAICGLAELLATSEDGAAKVEALDLLARIPETAETRRIAAMARAADPNLPPDVTDKLDALLDRVKGDEDARQEFLDLLELMGPTDERTAAYRKKLSAALF